MVSAFRHANEGGPGEDGEVAEDRVGPAWVGQNEYMGTSFSHGAT